jgi:hypothetical protein
MTQHQKKQFQDLPQSEQQRSIELAQIYFEHYPQYVIGLMRQATFNCQPDGVYIYRPELWKSYHWGWFVEYSGINPDQFQLHHTGTIPYVELSSKRHGVDPRILWVYFAVVAMGCVIGLFWFLYGETF